MELRSLVLVSFFFASRTLAVDNDFSLYPSAAQECLYDSVTKSGCDYDTVPENNDCLCGNQQGGWVSLTATCLGQTGVESSVIAETYSQMSTNCGDSSSPLGLTREEFFAAVAEGEAASGTITTTMDQTNTGTSTTPTGTNTSTSSPSEGGDGGSSGLSNGAKIGIIAGCAGAALIGIIIGVVFFFRRRRRHNKSNKPEAQPMITGQHPTAYPPVDPALPSQSPHVNTMYSTTPVGVAPGMYKDEDKWGPQSQQWAGTPQGYPAHTTGQGYPAQAHWAQQQMPGPYAVPPTNQQQHFAAELPSGQNIQMYELANTTQTPNPTR